MLVADLLSVSAKVRGQRREAGPAVGTPAPEIWPVSVWQTNPTYPEY